MSQCAAIGRTDENNNAAEIHLRLAKRQHHVTAANLTAKAGFAEILAN